MNVNELLPKERVFKLVLPYEENSDQDLFGFFPSEKAAKEAAPALEKQCERWVNGRKLIVKRTDPEMILQPVGTDFEHFNRALIPNEEFKRVMDSDASAEIDCNNMTCGCGTYYYLSRMIPKDWTVIDIGCAYNPQSYLFQLHARHIAVEPEWLDSDFCFEHFKAPNTELLFMTGQAFIKKELPKMNLDLKRTFCIVNYVPSDEVCQMARNIFPNIFTFYPA